MGSNNCLSKIIADVFPPLHCVNTHLNASDQQTEKTSAVIEVLTLDDDQLVHLISSTRVLLTFLISFLFTLLQMKNYDICVLFDLSILLQLL